MRKIKLRVQTISTPTGFELKGKGVLAISAGREIEFNRRSLIEASLQIPKPLIIEVTPLPETVSVELSQKFKHHSVSKCYILELKSEDLTDLNQLENSMKKITKFIRSIEADLNEEIENSEIKITELEFGGND